MDRGITDATDEQIIGYIDDCSPVEPHPIEVNLHFENAEEAIAMVETLAELLRDTKKQFVMDIQQALSTIALNRAYVFKHFLTLHDMLIPSIEAHDFKLWGRLPDPVKKRDKRRPFSIEQLRRIFNSPLYTGCVDDVYGYAKAGDAHPRRARFWIPIIALFSGMRMNEICQLKVGDIRTLDGVQCFVVIEDGDKRVKTAASERAIPVHQELIRIGFLAFVDEQRAAGQAEIASGFSG